MYIPKRYGESKIENCPFCGRQALLINEQGLPVCKDHKERILPELKCLCGKYLLMQKGKFGVYFNCMNCGNINMKKALETNDIKIIEAMPTKTPESKNFESIKESSNSRKEPSNITIRSDDPDYFD